FSQPFPITSYTRAGSLKAICMLIDGNRENIFYTLPLMCNTPLLMGKGMQYEQGVFHWMCTVSSYSKRRVKSSTHNCFQRTKKHLQVFLVLQKKFPAGQRFHILHSLKSHEKVPTGTHLWCCHFTFLA
ncbi:hypothetical protein NDU88_005077, partial [Pleurodeles waltl]